MAFTLPMLRYGFSITFFLPCLFAFSAFALHMSYVFVFFSALFLLSLFTSLIFILLVPKFEFFASVLVFGFPIFSLFVLLISGVFITVFLLGLSAVYLFICLCFCFFVIMSMLLIYFLNFII